MAALQTTTNSADVILLPAKSFGIDLSKLAVFYLERVKGSAISFNGKSAPSRITLKTSFRYAKPTPLSTDAFVRAPVRLSASRALRNTRRRC